MVPFVLASPMLPFEDEQGPAESLRVLPQRAGDHHVLPSPQFPLWTALWRDIPCFPLAQRRGDDRVPSSLSRSNSAQTPSSPLLRALFLQNGERQGHTMLTKDLVILWISSTMPAEPLRGSEELCATTLTPAFGYLAIKATDPGFNL